MSSPALRAELEGTGVTITCLMPGATDTEFSARAERFDTRLAQRDRDAAAMVAKVGYDALMNGERDVVTEWQNEIQATVANFIPTDMLAGQHRKIAATGSGNS